MFRNNCLPFCNEAYNTNYAMGHLIKILSYIIVIVSLYNKLLHSRLNIYIDLINYGNYIELTVGVVVFSASGW